MTTHKPLLSSGLFRFLLVVVILCVWVVRCIRSRGENGRPSPGGNALEVFQACYLSMPRPHARDTPEQALFPRSREDC